MVGDVGVDADLDVTAVADDVTVNRNTSCSV